MLGSKIAIFVDTNVFEKIGFNFDDRNQILALFKTLLKNKNYENICVSIIDNEIKNHINKKVEENKKIIKKHCKWIYDMVDCETIDKKIYKDLDDYEKFKNDTNTIYVNLNDINPEIVMSKHFNLEYPFELSKKNEFKDAFFLEAIYRYAEKNEFYSSFIIITNDKGIKKAIDEQQNRKIF